MRIIFSGWGRIAISIFFIILLFFIMRENFDELWAYLKNTKLVYFSISILLFLFIILILSIRLRRIMEIQGIFLPLSNVVYLNLIGLFFNNFLPTSVAGDSVKAYYTIYYTNKRVESYISIIVDRLFGIFAFAFIAGSALILADESIKTPLVTNSILILIFFSLILILLFYNRFFSKTLYRILDRLKLKEVSKTFQIFLQNINRYKNNFKVIIFAFSTSILSQIVSIFVVLFLAKGLSIDISLWLLFLTLPIITAVSMLPSLNGLGIRENAYVFLLGNYLGKERAFAMSILWLGTMLSISLLGGIVYLLRDILLKESSGS